MKYIIIYSNTLKSARATRKPVKGGLGKRECREATRLRSAQKNERNEKYQKELKKRTATKEYLSISATRGII